MRRLNRVFSPASLWILFLTLDPAPGAVYAQPVIEKNGPLELNWTTMELRFFGDATALPEEGDSFKSAERRAWKDALQQVSSGLSAMYAARGLSGKVNTDATIAKVQSTSYSWNTTYFGDGKVRVHLENPLPHALSRSDIKFKRKSAPDISHATSSGVVFRLSRSAQPIPAYEIVDETGAKLFDPSDVAEESYAKGLMGRWYKSPGPADLTTAVGASPLTIKATLNAGAQRLVVQRADWDKTFGKDTSLLAAGRIALVIP